MRAGHQLTAEAALLDAEECLGRRELVAALAGFHAAEKQGADANRCAAGRWMVWMLQGDFASAWRESDAIRRSGAHDPHRFWNGEDIRGKRLIVRCLHGFGDAVQFLRYAPALHARAKAVIFEVAPRFVELARCLEAVDHVITWGKKAPDAPPRWDVQMEVMELPYFFRTEVRDLPVAQCYLRLPRPVVARVGEQMGRATTARVGVAWSAGEWNLSRCVPYKTLTPLLKSTDFEFWNLQGTDPSAEPAGNPRCELCEVDGCRENILTLAAVISRVDLVITVDTLAAHLAGALGIPAWVMLQHSADWRWMTGTSRSPWYPWLRLFRQPRPGDWESVVADIQHALQAWSDDFCSRLIAS
jgi:hypothetical protein